MNLWDYKKVKHYFYNFTDNIDIVWAGLAIGIVVNIPMSGIPHGAQGKDRFCLNQLLALRPR